MAEGFGMNPLSIRFSALSLFCFLLSAFPHTADAQGFVGNGDWQSLKGEAIRGTWSVDLARTGTDLDGNIALTGSTLFLGGVVTGTIDAEQIVLGIMAEGVKQAAFRGRLDGDSISGEWECPAIKDEGVWTGTLRVQNGS
jgi:hypothetical protein